MNKKYLSALLFGAMAIASTSTFVSCKDYDDDIDNLQEQITTNANAITELQAWYNQGNVITNVEKDGKELKVTLSDGQTYIVSDGKDADVWTIGEDNFWYLNGEKTNYFAQGPQGEQGIQGEKGDKGDTGETGAQGPQGEKGDKGDTGETGAQGPQGEKGDKGDTGATGAQGAQGEKGDKGDTGETGAQGPQGEKGDKGDTGATGAQGAQGEKGDKGDTGAAGADGVDGGYYRPNLETGNFDYVTVDAEGKETVTATELSWKFNTLTAVQFPNKVVFSGIPGMEGDVVISTVIELKSLVLKPTLYYHGIQAIEIAAFNYQSLLKNAVDANGNYSKDAPYNDEVVGEVNMVPDMSATYHLNPSNAMVKSDVSNYKFAVLNKEYTRAINPKTVVPSIYKVDLSTKGLVTLTSHLANADLIQDIQRDEAVTVLALQYTEGDTTITSDYAAIRASEYKNLVLNNAYWSTDQNQHNHLFTTAAEAIADNEMVVPVKWNESIDLDKVVNTHRDVVKTKNTDVVWDKNAEERLVEKFGFKYSYELVGWWAEDAGSDYTSQSAHAAIGEGNILRPQMVKEGKQQAFGAEQNKATIGRQPLVRVTLTDTITNNIAAIGYVKFEIVEEDVVKPTESLTTVDFPAFTKPYTVACDNGEVFNENLVWYQVEEAILAKVNLSKEVFEANYTLEEGTSTIGATQYETNKVDAKILDPYFGKVEKVKEEVGGTTTDVLKWTVSNVEAYNYFKAKTSKTIYVRYKKTGSVGPVNYVCVALTWTPSELNVNPAASIEDGDKIKQYWYAKNNSTAGTGYADIHGNVEVVGQENAKDRFMFDVNNTFVGNTVQLKGLPAAYKAINDAKTIKFSFVKPEVNTDIPTASGAKYNVGVNADGTIFGTIDANNEITNIIASIHPTDGIITYADNDVAKDILNAADHSELGDRQTITGRVAITATTCDPAKAIELTNNTFNVKFLRPVTVKDGKAAFIDAETNGSVAPVELTFVDWRDHNFTDDKATKGENYFEYYGVASIEADIDNITTTLNGDPIEKGVKLSDITNNIKFEYTAPATISANNYGELKYENNGTTVGDFMIRVPIKVTYDWGTIYTYVDATVGKTEANANRR